MKRPHKPSKTVIYSRGKRQVVEPKPETAEKPAKVKAKDEPKE